MRRFAVVVGLTLTGLVIAATAAWGALALVFSGPADDFLRNSLAATFVLASLLAIGALASRRWRWPVLVAYGALFAVLVIWWRGIEPSNFRPWQTDVTVLPTATIEGDVVTVHNIRNFDYRSEFDYTPAYYDKRFEISRLEGVDLVAVYWMGPAVAHIFVSFAFAGGDHLAISIETRKERNEAYSTIKGFFRQYELYYVVADERDVIRLRTNYRHEPPEDVYVYRMAGSIENGRKIFLEYMNKINSLKERPEFYNTLTTNCTTNIWFHSLVNPEHVPFNWKILASGYLPQYLYELGRLDTSVPFTELQQRAHVNARAHNANLADFSRLIRASESVVPAGMPGKSSTAVK